ncbi:unnamed protein product [Prorocentrum cordatum]|uniref:JmjC domain-containing protein n=1 Tax=Prorocentrum cordatum TaxID=2364126 RepID=A0ABN9WNS8_9DINO|nr:unnamed protein product [Polarella glacialis]
MGLPLPWVAFGAAAGGTVALGYAGQPVREVSAAEASAEIKKWPEIYAEGLPVVFRGLAGRSKLLQAFSHKNLQKHADGIGGWSLNKGHGSGSWNSHAHEGGMWSLRQIEEYYEAQKGSSAPALQCFKSQGHVPTLELLQSVVDSMPPRLLQTAEIQKVHWWMGVNGSTVVTGLHTDLTHNFFFAAHGQGGKKFIMFAPWDGDNLHVWPKVWSYSEMLFDFYAFVNKTPEQLEEAWKHPDPERYPNFAKVQRYDVVLFPGDVLYIPIRWWHSGLNSGDVIGVNTWFWVPNPFGTLLEQIFSQKPTDEPDEWPKLAKLPAPYATLKAFEPAPEPPPHGVHPDSVRKRVRQRQQKLGCVRAQVLPFKKVFAKLEQFEEELTCLRGFFRDIWSEMKELVTGDYPAGSAELWSKMTGDKRFEHHIQNIYCPSDSPRDHMATFREAFEIRHDRRAGSPSWACSSAPTLAAPPRAAVSLCTWPPAERSGPQ